MKHPPEHTRELLSRLGNPQEGIKIIHVAGTNGKGSVCAYLNAMLLAGGKKTGLFTSPHLVRINERFQINGEDVSDEQFLDAFLKVEKAAKEYEAEGEGHPSYFETLFLMGMLIFKEAGVEYLVMETGLGGRLDATNVVEKPLACIITSISRDHTEYPVIICTECLGNPFVTFVRQFKIFVHSRFHKKHDFKGFVASTFGYRHVDFSIAGCSSSRIET